MKLPENNPRATSIVGKRFAFHGVVTKLTLLIAATIALAGSTMAQVYDPSEFNPARFEQYEDQLQALLRTRLDEEKLFVSRVVKAVEEGRIPAKLVQTSYLWVRNKRPDSNYPFVYFERVLRLQAKALEIEKQVPPFDYAVYQQAD